MKLILALIFGSLGFSQSVPAVNTPMSAFPLGNIPTWGKVVVANSSGNFTVTCTGAAAFVAACGTSPVAKAGATTQTVTLVTPGVAFVLDNCIVKSGTAFTGTTTLTGTIGVTGSLTGCVSVAYDLMAAVAAGNRGIPTIVPTTTSFNGTDAITLALISTIQNISSVSAGSVTIWLKIAYLP